MNLKTFFSIIILLVLLLFITGCKDSNVNENLSYNKSNTSKNNNVNTVKNIDYREAARKQMELPKAGETIAIIKVKNFGDIKVKFFDKVAPKAVENFITHSKNNYYNGTTFHRVMKEFMIQGGDPKGDGTGGESIWKKDFGEELSKDLVPYRGALCMASRGTGTNSIGSQFFIVQANYNEETGKMLKTYNYPEDLIAEYKNYGGYLSLYQGYTVFGQVFEGMNVVDKIADVEKGISTTGELSVPIEKVIVEKIEITKY